jgi:hypothetical protein
LFSSNGHDDDSQKLVDEKPLATCGAVRHVAGSIHVSMKCKSNAAALSERPQQLASSAPMF